jgi:DNA-binding transcriptional LysR family regulator
MRDLGRLEVVRQGSFSAAADVLGLSQSAVSQQVMALERDLEVELIDRSRRRLVQLETCGSAVEAFMICGRAGRIRSAERAKPT